MVENHLDRATVILKRILGLFISCILLCGNAYSIDDHHFYRASFLFQEPRFEKDFLGTFETWIGVGETCESRNCAGTIVPLFDLYGPTNLRLLGSRVPNKDPNNPADLALINLEKLPANGCFGKISIPGSFKVFESGVRYIQNFWNGFFTQAQLPLRTFISTPYHFVDLSPDSSSAFPNRATPEWQEFLRQFGAILARYNLSDGPVKQTGCGDLIWTLGWTRNFQDTEVLDFVDTTLQAGILVPTAVERNENQIFSIPFGYNGHWGFIGTIDTAYGAYEWLTLGAHAGMIAFLNAKRCNVRIKTDTCQNGLISLATADVVEEKRPLWDIGVYVKADHLGGKLSITCGYTYASQEHDFLCACPAVSQDLFDTAIVNNDCALNGWNMSTLNIFIEYDFSKENWRYGPRLGMIFNAQLGGKSVYKNNIVGGTFGLELVWSL
jgi:hypothetical protein